MAERMIGELASEHELVAAIHGMRERGYRDVDAYVPYLSHEVSDALEMPGSPMPWAVLIAGLSGAGGAYFLQWLLTAYLYPLNVGGRPPHFPLAYVLITFEMGVLIASLTAFFGVLVGGRLVRLVDGVQGLDGFRSASRDGFWIEVRVRERAEDLSRCRQALTDLGARRIAVVEGST